MKRRIGEAVNVWKGNTEEPKRSKEQAFDQASTIADLWFQQKKMADRINTYRELHVYQNAFDAAMEIFELTKRFPREEKYSLVDQIRRSSRSVCSDIAEA